MNEKSCPQKQNLVTNLTIPNVLSIARLGIVLFLPVIAWHGEKISFLIFLILALVSDMLDGWLARALHQTSPMGAMLDSQADLVLCFTIPLGVWWLWPEVVQREILSVLVLLGSYTLPTIFALIKYRRLPSYHTIIAKIAATITSIGGMILLFNGPAWPIHIASGVVLLEALEEIAITFILPQWTSNVPSLANALHLSKNRDKLQYNQ
jgi:CDP-diacylglycerol--glycerol-3-phosphate 3-phosphatidyltransferase